MRFVLRTLIDHEFFLGTTPSSAATSRSGNVSTTVKVPGSGRWRAREATTTDAHLRRYAVPAGLDGTGPGGLSATCPATSPTAIRGTVKVG